MSRHPIFQPCGVGQSLFQFIDKIWVDRETSNDRAFHRLCSLMRKMGAETVVIERLEKGDDSEVDEEKQALSLHLKRQVTFTKVFRLTFLSRAVKNSDELQNTDEGSFLAYAVIINAKWKAKGKTRRRAYILRSIVAVPSIECSPMAECGASPKRLPLFNTYFHVHRHFCCDVGLGNGSCRSYSIIGTFFSQQNQITSVCAHAALKMVVNNFPKTSPQAQGLLTTEGINRILSIDHVNNKLTGGLRREHVEKVLDRLGFATIQQDFFRDPTYDYAGYLHHLIESSCPCLLVFTTNKLDETHVVPVFGHTLNSHMWHPEAELAYGPEPPQRFYPYPNYRPATMWIDNFVIHDDNFGMYLFLPVDSLRRNTMPERDPMFRAVLAIGVVPLKFPTSGSEAEGASEVLARGVLNIVRSLPATDYWLETLCKETTAPLVIRTALLSRKRYRMHLGYKLKEKHKDSYGEEFDDDVIMKLTRYLPEHFWLSELALPDLYTTNKTKLIDVIYSATKAPTADKTQMVKKCIAMRFPGFGIRLKAGRVADHVPTNVYGHYPLFRVSRELALFEG